MKWSSLRVTRVTYLAAALVFSLQSNMLEKSGGQFVHVQAPLHRWPSQEIENETKK